MTRRPRRERHRIDRNKKPKKTIGGIPFFITMACLAILSCSNLMALPLLWDSRAYDNGIFAISGLGIGSWFTYIFVHGRVNVFIHEFKHALISGLVGNKATGLHIERDSGKFTYRYAPTEAKYNALILLAPYCVPLFTLPAMLIAWGLFSDSHRHMVMAVGIGFGADLLINFREVSPIQTDLTTVTGGYGVGVAFVLLFNLTVATFICAWFFQEGFGLKVLFASLWDFGLHFFYYLNNK